MVNTDDSFYCRGQFCTILFQKCCSVCYRTVIVLSVLMILLIVQHNGACTVLMIVNMPERKKKSNKFKYFLTNQPISQLIVLFVKNIFKTFYEK